MKNQNKSTVLAFLVTLTSIVMFWSIQVFAHCDTMNGPVVTAAKKALETSNVNLVLIWVQPQDEATIKEAFQKTVSVRKLSSEAQQLADMYFFETLVRIHRAGEGAPYTGLKPAGDFEPAVAATDKALEVGSAESLLQFATDAVQDGLRKGVEEVMAKKNFNPDDVVAGREYVRAYVEFIHYAERIYEAAKNPAAGHYLEATSEQEQAQHEEVKLATAQPEKTHQQQEAKDKFPPWVAVGILSLAGAVLAWFIWFR